MYDHDLAFSVLKQIHNAAQTIPEKFILMLMPRPFLMFVKPKYHCLIVLSFK